MRVLTEHAAHAQRGRPVASMAAGRLPLDLTDHVGDSLPHHLGSEMPPARQRRELEPMGSGELGVGSLVAPMAGGVLSSAVVPDADRRLAAEQRCRAVGPRPVQHSSDERFLHSVG